MYKKLFLESGNILIFSKDILFHLQKFFRISDKTLIYENALTIMTL